MQKYIEYVNKFQEGNEFGIYFIENQLKKHLVDNEENQTEIEEILDFVYSTKKYYKTIGYKTILEKTKAWHKKLATLETKDDEVVGVDYEIVKDFGDGFKFVKLISQNSYNREGKLMSHCVASYYGRNVAIYSLRDEKNNPHCTIEENNQVKGKGNQTVDNKYFGYCIKFLEEMGFSIGEKEMENIGYYKLEKIDKDLSVDEKYLYDGKYISDKHLDKIKDKDGETYYGFGLLNIKSFFEFDLNMKVKFNFDITKIKSYFVKSLQGIAGGSYSQLAGGSYSQLAGGSYSQLAGGDSSQLAGGDNSKLAGGSYSQLAGGDNSKLAGGSYSKLAGGDNSQLAGGSYSKLAGGYNSKLAGGSYSQLAGGSYSQLAGGSYSKLAGGDNSKLAGGDNSKLAGGSYSKLILTGTNGLAIGGNGSKFQGKIGNWFAIGETDDKGNYINFKVGKIDGEILKEDTLYILKNGEFIEFKE